MNNFLKIILRYHFHILFILLEVVAFILIINHNSYQYSVYYGTASDMSSSINNRLYEITKYIHTADLNQELIQENVELKNRLALLSDSTGQEDCYQYNYASIINASWNKTKNYLVLNKGRRDSIKEDNGVCYGEKIIGVIAKCSDNYSIVIPLINTNLKISGMVKGSKYFGSLQWDGVDYRYSYLYDIPEHVNVSKGDSIITTGFSSVFPEGKLLGVVDSVINQESSFNKLRVKLATDFKRVGQVTIIDNKHYIERKNLENEFLKDE